MSEIETPNATATPAVLAPQAEPTEPAIDPALIEKLAALKTIVKIDQILNSSLIPGGMAGDVMVSKEFLKTIHAPIMKECEAHPDFLRATNPEGYKKQLEEKALAEKNLVKADEKRSKKKLKIFGRAN